MVAKLNIILKYINFNLFLPLLFNKNTFFANKKIILIF